MILWTLATRNVLRNRRRSVITVLSIAIGLAALTFLWGFIDGMNRQMVSNTTRYFAGDVQVHLEGYHDDPSLDRAFAGADLVSAIRAEPSVAVATVRLETTALVSRGDKSRGIMAFGVDVGAETAVTDLFRAVVDGAPLGPADDTGVLIGEQLAQALGARAGDEVVFVGQAYDGSVGSARLRVRGVFRTKIDELDGYVAVMPLATMREFLAAPDATTAVVLKLRDRGELEQAASRLRERLGSRYEIVGWPVLLPTVAIGVRYHEVMGYVVLAIFFVTVGVGIVNPVLMAVLERTREFGVMLAVGTSPGRLSRLVLIEALLLGVAGLVLGNALGLGGTLFFNRTGIDLGAFEAGLRSMPGLSDIVYPVVRLERSVLISGLVFLIAFFAALYPAAKAASLEPVAAIRGTPGSARSSGGPVARIHFFERWPVFMRIAGRNVLRNRKRSAITIAGTAFAIVAYVFLYGYFDGFSEQIVDNSTRYVTGHIQIERPGLRRELAPELAFDPAPVWKQIASAPEVAAAAPRVQAQALASSASRSEGIQLYGIDPARERGLTFIHRTLVEGSALEAGADRDVLIGRQLAQKLGLRLGEKMVVMAPGPGGELGTAAYRIRGIFATESSAFDRAIAFVSLPAAQALLGLGQRVSTINLRLTDRELIAPVIAQLTQRLRAADLVVTGWQQLMPQVSDMVGLIGAIRSIVVAVFFVVVALAVMNTAFMAVAERTREFGVMMALGTPPAAILRMVVYETVVLMGLASLVGYAIGASLVVYLGDRGLDLSRLYLNFEGIPGLTGVAYPRLVVASLVGPGLGLFVASVAVSIYPALRAARLDPSAAIRRV